VRLLDAYAALDRALLISRQPAFEAMAQKVLFLTSGLPQGGLTSVENLEAMGRTLAEEEVAVSVFGVGSYFRRELPRALSEGSGGNFFVSASQEDLVQALQAEAESGFWPIARNLEIRAEAEPGYRIGQIYGAQSVRATSTTALLSSPTLFIGARQGSEDTSGGRRGGGGGWFVELIADSAPGMTARSETPVLRVEIRYLDALTGENVEQDFELLTPIGVGNNPQPQAPIFDPPISAKPFMMLNMYIALRGALSYYEQGACPLAMGMRDMMELSYLLWQEQHDDEDITDDFFLLGKLTDAFRQNCSGAAAIWPVEGTTGCFYM
jgi:Ca-activated chloride channel family protein